MKGSVPLDILLTLLFSHFGKNSSLKVEKNPFLKDFYLSEREKGRGHEEGEG